MATTEIDMELLRMVLTGCEVVDGMPALSYSSMSGLAVTVRWRKGLWSLKRRLRKMSKPAHGKPMISFCCSRPMHTWRSPEMHTLWVLSEGEEVYGRHVMEQARRRRAAQTAGA